ncbi:TetR/AcrR family transcriptional regulator [Arthrobacter sp. AQ5-05]|uniref:TetR/AcrR family transcriptional regulator n=1 Tax=Arthrobacter sp. AQ5-05 TaxID=2184581 RepID=UPI0012B559B5|nr:TetR/AcrR family transcriptional regulator [Arthrobacter sp. AQ5-05]
MVIGIFALPLNNDERESLMGRHSDKAREVLLDTAAELFALHGIDAVSNRRITEHAGTANHSAIAYHFGDREGLLRALLSRHLKEMNRRRAVMISKVADDADLTDILACMILPWIQYLADRPVTSWHARFLFQVRTIPSMTDVLKASAGLNPEVEALTHRLESALGHLPSSVVRGRAAILGPMVLGSCAAYEERVQKGEKSNWTGVGYFLIDSCAGMLAAPVTHPDEYVTFTEEAFLL